MSQTTDSKCPNCGNVLVWDPALGRLRCIGCGSLFDVPPPPEPEPAPEPEPEPEAEVEAEPSTKPTAGHRMSVATFTRMALDRVEEVSGQEAGSRATNAVFQGYTAAIMAAITTGDAAAAGASEAYQKKLMEVVQAAGPGSLEGRTTSDADAVILLALADKALDTTARVAHPQAIQAAVVALQQHLDAVKAQMAAHAPTAAPEPGGPAAPSPTAGYSAARKVFERQIEAMQEIANTRAANGWAPISDADELASLQASAQAAAEAAAQAAQPEPVSEANAAAAANASGLDAVECTSCGAQILVSGGTLASTICMYCHSPVVLKGQLAAALAPDAVVPFAINAEKARDLFHAWISRKRYLKTGFYSRARIDKLDGVYFPYFAVDADMQCVAGGIGHWTTGTGKDRQDHYQEFGRSGRIVVVDLPQEALRANRANKMINRLLPWDLSQEQPFQPQYLAGFQTERRDLDFQDVAPEVAAHLDLAAKRLIANDVFADVRQYEDLSVYGSTTITEWKHRYTLLPAWVLFYTAPGGEMYYFGVNGQTGETAGRLPVNTRKLALHATLMSIAGAFVSILGFIFL
ncbi:MAG: TFIIB-type zinc ribbon-containing protein [Bifidobacteriaceae bacterium]|nr:TFIIB-type zinc ribbon-containing protein [Bifidobacteriaceae bacterium]